MLQARCNDCGGDDITVIANSPNKKAGEQYYESRHGGAYKFWAIQSKGYNVYIRFGKIGTEGTTVLKAFDYLKDAHDFKQKMIREKTAKGYQEVY